MKPGLPEGFEVPGDGGDKLVQAAYANDPIEAEMIQGLLENAGIASLLQSARLNVDGPLLGVGLATSGFGGGPQRILVHAEQAQRARSLLADTLVENDATAAAALESAAEDKRLETANARNLGEVGTGRVRDYGVVGAYARAMGWSLVVIGAAAGIFFLLRAF